MHCQRGSFSSLFCAHISSKQETDNHTSLTPTFLLSLSRRSSNQLVTSIFRERERKAGSVRVPLCSFYRHANTIFLSQTVLKPDINMSHEQKNELFFTDIKWDQDFAVSMILFREYFNAFFVGQTFKYIILSFVQKDAVKNI